jgi:prostaglandin-endoperoxide synthase 2
MGIFDEVLGGISGLPLIGDELNRAAINHLATRTVPRPRPFSLWSPVPAPNPPEIGPVSTYTTWPGLTDRRFSGRHLPVADPAYMDRLASKPAKDLLPLFERDPDSMIPDRSSALFMFFAQWFTDSILRVDPSDRRRNTSNHDIDLCQIYGLTEETTRILRSLADGKLRCQTIGSETFPAYLYEQNTAESFKVKPEFSGLPYVGNLDNIFADVPQARRQKVFATGLERGNSSIGYVAISTLFLREHNRICDRLAADNPAWDDERLFQTARMINIVLLMKVVVEDYINHIAGHPLFKLDTRFAEDQNWYRTNWIAIEFDLLYRWHGLVPDAIEIQGAPVLATDYRNNNPLLTQHGLAVVLSAASQQPAGRIGLWNSPSFLAQADLASLLMSRAFALRSYNDYRERFSLDRLQSFDELTRDAKTRNALATHYQSIDDVEFLVGLLAEDRTGGALFGDLLNSMVAYDAFTQIFTNPLLSRNVFNEQTLTAYGLNLIESTGSVRDIAKRNITGAFVASLGWNAD